MTSHDDVCPRCCASSRRRIKVTTLQNAATVLIPIFFFLLITAMTAETPIRPVANITAADNFKHVRVQIRVTRLSYEQEENAKIPEILLFGADTTKAEPSQADQIKIKIGSALSTQLADPERAPLRGDKLDLEGTVNAGDGYKNLAIQKLENYRILEKASPLYGSVSTILGASERYRGKKVIISQAVVVDPFQPWKFKISDSFEQEQQPSPTVIVYGSKLAAITKGDRVTVRGDFIYFEKAKQWEIRISPEEGDYVTIVERPSPAGSAANVSGPNGTLPQALQVAQPPGLTSAGLPAGGVAAPIPSGTPGPTGGVAIPAMAALPGTAGATGSTGVALTYQPVTLAELMAKPQAYLNQRILLRQAYVLDAAKTWKFTVSESMAKPTPALIVYGAELKTLNAGMSVDVSGTFIYYEKGAHYEIKIAKNSSDTVVLNNSAELQVTPAAGGAAAIPVGAQQSAPGAVVPIVPPPAVAAPTALPGTPPPDPSAQAGRGNLGDYQQFTVEELFLHSSSYAGQKVFIRKAWISELQKNWKFKITDSETKNSPSLLVFGSTLKDVRQGMFVNIWGNFQYYEDGKIYEIKIAKNSSDRVEIFPLTEAERNQLPPGPPNGGDAAKPAAVPNGTPIIADSYAEMTVAKLLVKPGDYGHKPVVIKNARITRLAGDKSFMITDREQGTNVLKVYGFPATDLKMGQICDVQGLFFFYQRDGVWEIKIRKESSDTVTIKETSPESQNSGKP
jgi:hypothetical protein